MFADVRNMLSGQQQIMTPQILLQAGTHGIPKSEGGIPPPQASPPPLRVLATTSSQALSKPKVSVKA